VDATRPRNRRNSRMHLKQFWRPFPQVFTSIHSRFIALCFDAHQADWKMTPLLRDRCRTETS
jgi:hypothetical protein